MKDSSQSGLVELRLICHAGFRLEEPKQLHLAHVLEHAAFGKSQNIDNNGAFLRAMGLQPAIDYNANTGRFRTTYRITVPRRSNQRLFELLGVLAEWANRLTLDSASVEMARWTVLNEIGKPDSTSTDCMPPALGSLNDARKNVLTFKRKELVDFYTRWYRPDLQALVVVGDVEIDTVESYIRRLFTRSNATNGIRPRFPKYRPSIPKGDKILYSCSSLPEVRFEYQHIVYAGPTVTSCDLRNDLITRLIDQMAQARSKSLSTKMYLINQRFVRNFDYESPFSAFRTSVRLSKDTAILDIQNHLEVTIADLERLRRYGYTNRELKNAKMALHSANSTINNNLAMISESYCDNYITGEIKVYNLRSEKDCRELLDEITLDDCNRYLKAILDNKPQLKIFKGTKVNMDLPKKAKIREITRAIKRTWLKPYSAADSATTLSVMTPMEIEQFTNSQFVFGDSDLPKIGGYTVTLGNGVQVYFRPTKCKVSPNKDVEMLAFRKLEQKMTRAELYVAARLTTRMVTLSGLGCLDSREMDEFKKSNGIKLTPYISRDEVGFRGQCRPETAVKMIQLMYLLATNAKIDKDAFAYVINEFQSDRKSFPPPSDSVEIHYTGLIERHNGDNLIKTDSLSMLRLLTQYKTLFSDLAGMQVVFTGDFDAKILSDAVIPYFADFPGSEPAAIRRQHSANQEGTVAYQFIADEGNNNQNVSLLIVARKANTIKEMMSRRVFSRILNEILFQRLREELGAVYSIEASYGPLGSGSDAYSVWFRTNKGSVNLLVDEIWQAVSKIDRGLLDHRLVENAITSEVERLSMEMCVGRFWHEYFRMRYENDTHVYDVLKWKDSLQTVTIEDIVNCAAAIKSNLQKHTYEYDSF